MSGLKIALWDRSAGREVTAQAQPALRNPGPRRGADGGAFWGRFVEFLCLLMPRLSRLPLPTVGMQIIQVTCPLSKKMGKTSPFGQSCSPEQRDGDSRPLPLPGASSPFPLAWGLRETPLSWRMG